MTLVESVVKKARFLEEVVRALELPVRVVTARAEIAARELGLRESFASATARAVAGAPVVIELTIPFLRLGGVAVLQRGELTVAERAAAADAALVLGAQIEADIPVARESGGESAGSSTADGDEAAGGLGGARRILILRKVAATGQRFPRRVGVPAKRPLCWADGD